MRRDFTPLPCRLAGWSAVVAASTHVFPRHIHDDYGIGVLVGGAQKSASGRGPVEAGAGDVITVNPGEVHDGAPIGDHGRRWRMLYIDPVVLLPAYAEVSDGRRGFEFDRPALGDPRLAASFHQLFAALTRPTPADLAAEQAMVLLLAELNRRQNPDPRPAPPPPIGRALARIDDDPAAPLTLSDLAAVAGLSRFQLIRGFQRHIGLTPHHYLMQRRLHLARRLITQGLPLAAAAADSGFADQSHLTRLFTRVHGLPPGAYAEALQSGSRRRPG